jgi:hypothetical protein
MKLKYLIAGVLGAMLLGGPAYAGDAHDIYKHSYKMCQKIVRHSYRVTPITKTERKTAIQSCLSHETRYF